VGTGAKATGGGGSNTGGPSWALRSLWSDTGESVKNAGGCNSGGHRRGHHVKRKNGVTIAEKNRGGELSAARGCAHTIMGTGGGSLEKTLGGGMQGIPVPRN